MKPIPFAEINRELVPKDPLEAMKYGTALAEKCRLGHNAEPLTLEGNRRRKSLWLPRIRAACAIRAQAMLSLPKPETIDDVVFDRREFLQTNSGKALLNSIDNKKAFVSSDFSTPKEIDPLEDFTTYTEYDPQSKITVTSYQITVTNAQARDTGRVFCDYGIGFFGDFTHYNKIRIDSASGTGSIALYPSIWSVSNVVQTVTYMHSNRSQALAYDLICMPDNTHKLALWEFELRVTDETAINKETYYYLKMERVSTTLIAYIYTDSQRTNLLDTATVSVPSGRTYRYVFGTNSTGCNSTSPIMSYTIADLDLGLTTFQPAWAEGINTHHF